MSGLGAFGAFAGGVASGYERGLALREKIEKRKKEKEEQDAKRQEMEAGAEAEAKFDINPANIGEEQPITVEGQGVGYGGQFNNVGLSNLNYTEEEPQQLALGGLVGAKARGKVLPRQAPTNPVIANAGRPQMVRGMGGLQDPNGTSLIDRVTVRKLADGGLVDESIKPKSYGLSDVSMAADPNSVSYQTNQATPQAATQTAPPAQKADFGKRLSARYNAMRDKALELGRMEAAKDYHNLGFQVRDRMVKEGITNAQRQFQMTGDIRGFVSIYNDAIDDGATIDGYEKTENGYALRINDNGNVFTKEVSPDEIKGMVMEFSDPAHRYAAEAEYNLKIKAEKFKTDEEIRKQKAIEKDKVHTVGLDSVLMKGDGEKLYDGSANRPAFKTEQDVLYAANNPEHPHHEIAKQMLNSQVAQKSKIAAAGRAPQRETESERSFSMWKQENPQGTYTQYRQWVAGLSKAEPLDSVTEATVTYDDDGNEKRTSRTSRVKPNNPAAKTKQAAFDKDAMFKKYGIK